MQCDNLHNNIYKRLSIIPLDNIYKCDILRSSRRTKQPKGKEGKTMYEKLYERQAELYNRLDNLEGCEDNPIYRDEIKSVREELANISLTLQTEFF